MFLPVVVSPVLEVGGEAKAQESTGLFWVLSGSVWSHVVSLFFAASDVGMKVKCEVTTS